MVATHARLIGTVFERRMSSALQSDAATNFELNVEPAEKGDSNGEQATFGRSTTDDDK
jgi:hypothetical protein